MRFAAMANFGFQTRHFSIGRVHVTLRLMQRIARSKVGFARRFELGFGFTQGCGLGFQIIDRPFDFKRDALAFGLGLVLFQQPQELLLHCQLIVQGVVFAR